MQSSNSELKMGVRCSELCTHKGVCMHGAEKSTSKETLVSEKLISASTETHASPLTLQHLHFAFESRCSSRHLALILMIKLACTALRTQVGRPHTTY